ncbi:MAG TPA: hypothetical protein VMT81_00905 [Candidatus Paceibacterota bacterium]|nr:hypothetical protein [Candidatus Paceibacterota bacterium]
MPIIKNQALNSVNPATPVPMDFQPAPKMIAQTFQATPKFAAPVPVPPVPAPKPVPILAPMSAAPQPAKPFDAGWSKATPQGPVVRLGTITPAVPVPPRPSAPVVAQTPKPAAAQPTTPGSPVKTVSEFDRLDILKGGSAPKPAPAPAPKPPEPAPVMLHQVSTSATVQNSPDIQAKLGARDQMKGSVPMPAPVRPAILEFGTTTAPVPPAPKPAFAGGPRMPAPPPIPSAGPRTITEVTTPKQQVTAPPPVPPGPRTPPATEKSKVIVKDFL